MKVQLEMVSKIDRSDPGVLGEGVESEGTKSEELEEKIVKLEATLAKYESMIRDLMDEDVVLDFISTNGIATEAHKKMDRIGNEVFVEREIYSLSKREDEQDEEGSVLQGKELCILKSYLYDK